MSKKLKNPKNEILSHMAIFLVRENKLPTLDELCTLTGLRAKSTISQHLHELGIDYSKEKYKVMNHCPFCKKEL